MNRLNRLLQTHSIICEAGKLPENIRPWSIQSDLNEIHKLIMEELKVKDNPTPQPNLTDDIIPF